MSDVLAQIQDKLIEGEELTSDDLLALKHLHQSYFKAVHSNDHNGDEIGQQCLDYLDRSFLNNPKPVMWQRQRPQLVRYVGMVQDMLDPEYYATKDEMGRSMHFRDVAYAEASSSFETVPSSIMDNDDTSNYDLAERVPLVVVPIPFASDWLVRGIARLGEGKSNSTLEITAKKSTESPKSVVLAQEPSPIQPRKRTRDQEHHSSDYVVDAKQGKHDDDKTAATSFSLPTKDCDVVEDNGQGETTECINDWWPAGTCGTPEDQCPVLAKICYDQILVEGKDNNYVDPAAKRRLMLNDIVSMIGVLSVNPWEADFPEQYQQQRKGASEAEWMRDHSGELSSYGPVLPPPSRMPRLHVLSYEWLDLDDLARSVIFSSAKQKEAEEMAIDSVTTQSSAAYHDLSRCAIPSFLTSLLGDGVDDDARRLSQALWMCLLSKGERYSSRNVTGHYELKRAGPMERALGCFSLQISTPDLVSSRDLFTHLAKDVLPEICPVVATMDLQQQGSKYVSPCKESNGRLRPCASQLPPGSVLLVHYRASPPSKTNNENNIFGLQAVIQELVQHHRLPYRFEGGVVLPFEADYRIIVVTTQTHHLPCTASILTKTTGMRSKTDCHNHTNSLVMLRETLCRGRSISTNKGSSLKLSPLLLERAQLDFLARRRQLYNSNEANGYQVSLNSSSLPGEDDFHRWLNIAKLQAKSRLSFDADCGNDVETTITDWEVAMQFDDAIRGTTT